VSTTVRRHFVLSPLAPLSWVLAMSHPASADNFGAHHYDRATNELVVTKVHGGTNSNHKFTLKWGACEFHDSGRRMPLVNADILDDQFNDAEPTAIHDRHTLDPRRYAMPAPGHRDSVHSSWIQLRDGDP
jgi:hypothetical protein